MMEHYKFLLSDLGETLESRKLKRTTDCFYEADSSLLFDGIINTSGRNFDIEGQSILFGYVVGQYFIGLTRALGQRKIIDRWFILYPYRVSPVSLEFKDIPNDVKAEAIDNLEKLRSFFKRFVYRENMENDIGLKELLGSATFLKGVYEEKGEDARAFYIREQIEVVRENPTYRNKQELEKVMDWVFEKTDEES